MEIKKRTEAYGVMRKAVILAALLLAAAAAFFAARPAKAAEAGVVTLNADSTYTQYDVTGDGAADTFKAVSSYSKKYGFYTGLSIYINGEKAKSFSDWYEMSTIKLCRLKNGKTYIFIQETGDNSTAYNTCGFYKYESGKLKQVLNILKECPGYGNHFNADVLSVSGNTINVKFWYMTYTLGSVNMTYKYKYNQGSLKRTSNVTKTFTMGKKRGTLNYSREAYSKPSSETPSFTFTKGTKVKAVAISIKNSKLYIKLKRVSDGKTGWVRGVTDSEFGQDISGALISGNELVG